MTGAQINFLIITAILFAGCAAPATNDTTLKQTDTTSVADSTSKDSSEAADIEPEAMATFFVVIADTGKDYFLLHNKMFSLSKALPSGIDTMGRGFNAKKNLIALPEDDGDEMYAGDYFPRRFPSRELSLEYLFMYSRPTAENTIALVTGIYEIESEADSALNVLKHSEKNSFKVKADIYIGCMH